MIRDKAIRLLLFKILADPEFLAGRPRGSVGRVDPTRICAPLGRQMGRSVGSTTFRPKIFFAALRAAVGRSVLTESET